MRRYIANGALPEPYTVVGGFMMYKVDGIRYRFQHGHWPRGMKFRYSVADPEPSD